MIRWNLRNKLINLDNKFMIMGILNVTPDSFSDGGDFFTKNNAINRALEMIDEGADIIDIGGESTRPYAEKVSLDEELYRTIPVISKLRQLSDCYISIDTTKSEVARQALIHGADIINDISAMELDKNMINVAQEYKASTIIMHMKGTPQDMQDRPNYKNASIEIKKYLLKRYNYISKKIGCNSLISLDPGIGFGKTFNHNINILKNINIFAESFSNSPITIGLSRKSFMKEIFNIKTEKDRDPLTSNFSILCYKKGVRIFRVHNVKLTKDALDATLLTN